MQLIIRGTINMKLRRRLAPSFMISGWVTVRNARMIPIINSVDLVPIKMKFYLQYKVPR